ncbi:hypothetical protein [Streptomyces cucumeris]|uniref:hypothetical protein n=1 Tax=Streptomyces cucumeris TaxID=2962890 RepID=UPI0020C92868|nr:hypothetical protein [Streptomyces sp. NEAU-Y11]MCP9205495.1 hypothetical protein [Streptomyces sp. NEAU-Y11]
MIVDPLAPPVTLPTPAVSADGWLTAVLDPAWSGVVLSVDYTAATPLAGVADVRKVLITRLDPGAAGSVPVRGADLAWCIEGVGAAYDHEAPLGRAVTYTARPTYADGTTGPASSVAVTLPDPSGQADVWIKSLDEPGVSARVTVTSWPALSWAARIDSADVMGSRYPITSQDEYKAASSDITLDAEGDAIEIMRKLLTTPGVRLLQTRADARRPDQFVLLGDPAEAIDTTPTGARTFTAQVTEVERPPTAGQPMRMPGWSYDALAAAWDSYDAVASAYSSFASLATNGAA